MYYDEYAGSGPSAMATVVSLALAVFTIVVTWRIFEKAGEHGWASLIPFYNAFVAYRIAWGSGWMMLLLLVPLFNVVFGIMTMFRLARVFGKGVGFGFGLLFLNVIFMAILAFGDARYVGIPGKFGPDPNSGWQSAGSSHICACCGARVSDGTRFCPHCGARQ